MSLGDSGVTRIVVWTRYFLVVGRRVAVFLVSGGVRGEMDVLLQVELLPRGTKRKPVICRFSQQRHYYLTC